MMKNLILLVALAWVSFSYAKHPVAHESISEAEAYKVEKPVAEQDAQRSVAGDRIKKKKHQQEVKKGYREVSEPDSEVRYWQYSE